MYNNQFSYLYCVTDSLLGNGYNVGKERYLELKFSSDIRDVRRGFYAEYTLNFTLPEAVNYSGYGEYRSPE